MMSQRKDVVKDLLFQLSSKGEVDDEESRRLRRAVISEIQDKDFLDLHYTLSSNGRNLGDKQLRVLVNILMDVDLSHLQVFNLSGCFFQRQSSVNRLAEVLEASSMPVLKYLDLSGHYSLQGNGIAALVRALKSGKYSRLEHLGLPRCDIDTVVEAIQEGELRQLQNLVISGAIQSNKPGKRGAALPKLLQGGHLPHLRKLVLMSLSVDPSGMEAIVNALYHPLEHLDISSNVLGDEACSALSELFEHGDLQLIQRLRLYSCSISSQQLTTIVEGFELSQSSNSLRFLDLSWNRFGDEGAFALASVIRGGHLSSLLRLNLGHCDIGARGIIAILEALGMAEMIHLEWLNLLGNRIGEDGASAVAAAVAGTLDTLPRLERVNLIDSRYGCASLFAALKIAVKQQDPAPSFIAEDCGLKRATLPFLRDPCVGASNF